MDSKVCVGDMWYYENGYEVEVIRNHRVSNQTRVVTKSADGVVSSDDMETFLRCYTKISSDKYKLIGISGLAGGGKNTVGGMLLMQLGLSWQPYAFADPIKKMLDVLGVDTGDDVKDSMDEYYGVSPRVMMQTLGTGWGRGCIDEDVWIKVFKKNNPYGKYLITDIRRENEADFIRKHGVLIHVKGRGGIETKCLSESGIKFKDGDFIVDNSSSLYYTKQQVEGILELIKRGW